MGTNGAGTALAADRPVAVLGSEHWMRPWQGASCLAAPLHGPGGAVAGAIVVTTASQDCRPELLGLVAHVALTIDRELAARQLDPERRAREAAERRQLDREHLLAAVAHDLRGPNLVVSLAAGLPDSELDRARVRIKRACSRIEGLVRDLLDFSRLNEGRFGVVRVSEDVGPWAVQVAELFEPLAKAASIQLVCEVPAEPVALRFDPSQLERAVSNVVLNALKFTPAGGKVVIRIEPGMDEVLLTVTDSGPGFSDEDLTRLFEPYWSGHLRSDSTGLGLAIASGIVQAHGGRISAENVPGGGARFAIALPRHR
jgi:signal transduction histidine kinase